MRKTNSHYFFHNTDDQSDDDSSASVAEPAYSPDKEEGRPQRDVTDHGHLEQLHSKGSVKPWLSPCSDVPEQISSPLKCPDFSDKEVEDRNNSKKSRRTSVRKKPAEKHKPVGLLESPCQDWGSDNGKNFHKEKRRSKIKSSPNISEKGKRKGKAAKSFTETETHFFPNAVNSSSCFTSLAKVVDATVEPSKRISTSPQKIEWKTPKRARTSLSNSVRSVTLSGDFKSVASCSTDGDENVFEDYFSPANCHKKSKRLLLPNLPVERDIQIPFDLGSGPNKRKQRRSESIGSETNSTKRKKLEKHQTGKSQQSDASSEPQSHPQQDLKESLPAVASQSANATLVAKQRRQSTLPFTCTRTTSGAVRRRASGSVQTTTLTEANTVLELQKNTDVSVLSDTLESE